VYIANIKSIVKLI